MHAQPASPRPIHARRVVAWRRIAPAHLIAVATTALAAIAATTSLLVGGSGAPITAIVIGFVLVVPGDLVRRASFPRWRPGPAWILAIDVLLSMALVISLGIPLAIAGSFRLVGPALAIAVGVLAAVAARRRGLTGSVSWSLSAVAGVVFLAAVGLILFHLRSTIPDRIALGQLDTAVDIASLGAIPQTTTSFGAIVPYPTHYLFYDMVVGALVASLGPHPGDNLIELMAALRGPTVGWLALGFALAGHALIGVVARPAVRTSRFTWAIVAAAAPGIALFNGVMQAKVREALTEGIALGLLGVALAAVILATDGRGRRRRRWFAIGGTAVGAIAGIHLPALAGAAMIVGTWVAFAVGADAAAWLRARRPSTSADRGRRRRLRPPAWLARAWPIAVIPIAALVVYDVAGGGTLGRLLGGAVTQASIEPERAYRAILLMSADPLSTLTPAQFLARYLQPAQMYVQPAYAGFAAIVLALGVATLAARLGSVSWRVPVWVATALIATTLYAESGALLSVNTISPWNAIMRNSFYAWLPLTFIAVLGIAGLSLAALEVARGMRRGRRLTTALPLATALVAVAFVVQPIARAEARQIRSVGWLAAGQMTPAGHRALLWIAANTPTDSVILTPEVTYGSELLADRVIASEGKGTLESPEVSNAAIDTLEGTIAFYLPPHDPGVVLAASVDYVVTMGNGAYTRPQFGGLPLLRSYVNHVTGRAPDIASLPWLGEVYHDGDVVIYRVLADRIPAVQVDRLTSADAVAPPCAATACFTYRPAAGPCPPDHWTARRDVCVDLRLPSG